MPSNVKPQISAGQPLDVQPGVSNIGENQAELDALRNANIDGQDIFPQSVSTRRFSAEDGAFSGNIYAGSMLIGTGGMTITSDPDLGTPNTGLYLDSSVLYLIKDGVATVTLDGKTGSATFTGAITGGTISSMGSVNFGTDVTIGGALIINGDMKLSATAASHTLYYEYPNCYSYWNTSGDYLMTLIQEADSYFTWAAGLTGTGQHDAQLTVRGGTTADVGAYIGLTGTTAERDITIECGTTSTSKLSLRRGTTDVMSFAGDSDTITCPGNIIVGAGADYVLTGYDASTPQTVRSKLRGVSVTSTGNFATAAWTHGWDTSRQFVTFSATMHGIDTGASTGISNVRVVRASVTTAQVEFNVATYVSTQTINFDVMAMGPA